MPKMLPSLQITKHLQETNQALRTAWTSQSLQLIWGCIDFPGETARVCLWLDNFYNHSKEAAGVFQKDPFLCLYFCCAPEATWKGSNIKSHKGSSFGSCKAACVGKRRPRRGWHGQLGNSWEGALAHLKQRGILCQAEIRKGPAAGCGYGLQATWVWGHSPSPTDPAPEEEESREIPRGFRIRVHDRLSIATTLFWRLPSRSPFSSRLTRKEGPHNCVYTTLETTSVKIQPHHLNPIPGLVTFNLACSFILWFRVWCEPVWSRLLRLRELGQPNRWINLFMNLSLFCVRR